MFMQIVIFQTIHFTMSTQFDCQKHFCFKSFSLLKQIYIKQFSTAYERSIDVKTVLFKAVQFSTITKFNSKNISISNYSV